MNNSCTFRRVVRQRYLPLFSINLPDYYEHLEEMKSKTLRQNAEKQLGLLKKEKQISFSETETLKLLHELQVHQIELEMQNANLVLANEQEKLAKEKYKELYDFAPSAYFTLSMDGNIIELKLKPFEIITLIVK